MHITRRRLLQCAAGGVASANRAAPTAAALDPNSLTKFADSLSVPEIVRNSGRRPSPDDPSREIPFYRLAMRQIERKVHRDLPATRMWGFGSSSPGPTFETRSGEGLLVEWANELPAKHFLPIDHNLHGAEAGLPEVRGVVHLHGAKAPPASDGYPEAWCLPGKSAVCYYPNRQEAAMLWYHDHTMGINRLNTYAGLFGAFIVRDAFEDALNLPRGPFEMPLIICDRMLRQDGQLEYPVSGRAGAPWVPEVFGNAFLVNGNLFPYLHVEPRKYRLRVLNACNGRFLHLVFSDGRAFHQIGTDQGLLPAPVPLQSMLLAPAERADLIVDFAGLRGGQTILRNDFVPVMQFRVGDSAAADAGKLPAALRPVPKTPEPAAVKTRLLPLIENRDAAGDSMSMLLNGAHWSMPVTENPALDTVEIWTLINTTDDSHPIHLHLVRFQILDRRRFDPFTYQTSGKLRYTGAATPPAPEEAGWKDTVRADPKMVTRIIVRFEGYAGRYVWHCHILEHEDNEMMRPYDVVPSELE
ncbi:MAG: multicopper oxidase [Bryobacteraceae bacterium]|jgi:spore coat protein A